MIAKYAAEPDLLDVADRVWGDHWVAVLYVNGFPHKRIIRRDRGMLVALVREWLLSPLVEWSVIE